MTRIRTLFTRTFWLDALERAVKTAAQSAVLVVGAGQVDALSADWLTVGGFALGGALLSVLTSMASAASPGISPASLLPPGA